MSDPGAGVEKSWGPSSCLPTTGHNKRSSTAHLGGAGQATAPPTFLHPTQCPCTHTPLTPLVCSHNTRVLAYAIYACTYTCRLHMCARTHIHRHTPDSSGPRRLSSLEEPHCASWPTGLLGSYGHRRPCTNLYGEKLPDPCS